MTQLFWEGLVEGIILTVVYGVIGIALAVLGFKMFDWITPRVDIERELSENRNVAVAIICAAVILGISTIAAIAIR